MKEDMKLPAIGGTDRVFTTKRKGNGKYNPARGGDKRIDAAAAGSVGMIRDGGESAVIKRLRALRPDGRSPKLMHYNKLRLLTERVDDKGNRLPFRVTYAAKNGDILDDVCVCTNVEPLHKRRTVLFVGGRLPRTLRDVLILEVDDYKIVVN